MATLSSTEKFREFLDLYLDFGFSNKLFHSTLLYATEACPLLWRNKSFFEFTVTRLFMKLFRTTSPAVIKCCQQAFNFLPVHSQPDIRTANFLQKFIASENSLCCLFALTARRKLKELFVQFDNATTACQFCNAILDSLTC